MNSGFVEYFILINRRIEHSEELIRESHSYFVVTPGSNGVQIMLPIEWEEEIEKVIASFPPPHSTSIGKIWDDWLAQNPEPPYHTAWSDFASTKDDQESLYTETRIYLKKVTNELREFEIPLTTWQKVAKAFAAVASIFLVIFLAISRVARASD